MASLDDSFSDDSSDDEFLTDRKEGSAQDREAMIRRKLMESFYGKSMPKEEKPKVGQGPSIVKKKETLVEEEQEPEHREEDIQTTSDDLDSPYFDADAHTSKYVVQANVHDVLEVEERLALQVRTLDSTMQTLVYENYSKFIDATDAIRSIGVSVHANEEGLGKLSKGMQIIDQQSRAVEDALGTLRDAVAEKLRIKRLLTRLDTLLRLPSTLKQQIKNGQYRLATKSYISAHAILSKHSAGFESLKTIELDCHSILTDMVKTMKCKLLHWSGQARSRMLSADEDNEDDCQDDSGSGEQSPIKEGDEECIVPPEPPQSVSEIFECASTLLIVLPKDNDGDVNEDVDKPAGGITFDSGLSGPECKAAALAATIRYLERVVDEHQVELQDAMFNTGFGDDTFDAGIVPPTSPEINPSGPKESKLIPIKYLDSVLEAATLYGISFSIDGKVTISDGDRQLLKDFVNEAFAAFLSYVRMLLLERSAENEMEGLDEAEKEDIMMDDEDGDEAYSEISEAMTHLLRAVRDLASGLALPDVGVDVDFASSLVEQAVVVTETMVRRRVAQKFVALRLSVVQECLAPFAKESVTYTSESATARVTEIVQMASVALSDGLQLVDDTVKSILTGGVVVSDLKGVDYAMVKEAVDGCCRRFAMWLAATLEILAGCENSDPKMTIEPAEYLDEPGEESNDDALKDNSERSMLRNVDEISEVQQDSATQRVDSILEELCDELDNLASPQARSDLTLAISEMCRLAQRTVMENINVSLSSTGSTGSRKHNKNSDIFASSGTSSRIQGLNKQNCTVSNRFMVAASRVVILYATNRGSEAALFACKDMHLIASEDGDELPEGPRSAVVSVLEIARTASIDCANVYGGKKRAGPVPDLPEDEEDALNTGGPSAYTSSMRSASKRSIGAGIKGLSLDVERMFTEKVPTYPHPSRVVEFSRNSVVFIVLKVAFNALMEQTRTCTFRTKGYRQLQVDVLLLKYLIPHYVVDDLHEGNNARAVLEQLLGDILSNAGERCRDLECIDQGKFFNPTNGETTTLQSIIRDYMSENDSESHKDGAEEMDEKEPHPKFKFLIEDDVP